MIFLIRAALFTLKFKLSCFTRILLSSSPGLLNIQSIIIAGVVLSDDKNDPHRSGA